MGSAALRLLRLLGIRYLMAARSIWNGTVAFGLVNVPVKLYSATESKTVWFSDVHARDHARIEHRRVARVTGLSQPLCERHSRGVALVVAVAEDFCLGVLTFCRCGLFG